MTDFEPIRRIINAMPVCEERHVVCRALRPGAASLDMEVPAAVLEPSRTTPAALVFGLGDMAASFALHTTVRPQDLHVSTGMSMTVRAGAPGPLRAEGQVVRTGRRQAFAGATVRDAAGRVCAVFNGTFAIAADSPHAIARAVVENSQPTEPRPWRPASSRAAACTAATAQPGGPWVEDRRTIASLERFVNAPLSRALGIYSAGRGTGAVGVRMRVPGELRSPGGAVPGVIVGGLAERAASLAVTGAGNQLVSLEIHFLRPATGVELGATAETLGRSRFDDPFEITRSEVLDADGTPVAAATATWHREVRRLRPSVQPAVAQVSAWPGCEGTARG